MEELRVKEISFESYLKLLILIFLLVGLILGILFFIMSIFGGNVNVTLWTIQLRGVIAGIVSIPLLQLMFSLVGLIIGILSFLPFKYVLKFKNGITINLNYDQDDINSK